MLRLETDYQHVYYAWTNFKKGKKPSQAIDIFAYHLEENVLQLSDGINSQTYRHGGYKAVVLQEKKRRDLAVADVRDRVVHRLLYDYLLQIFDRRFDPDVWSCRKNKGLHACLQRTQHLLAQYHHSYVWRADIIKFFDQIHQETLLHYLKRVIGEDKQAMWLCRQVIISYATSKGRGIPIGNLTSQIFANIYLHEFDRFVRHYLKPQAYIRYGDDFIVLFATRRQTQQARDRAVKFLDTNVRLSVNPKNDIIVPARSGLRFLGHFITDTTAVVDWHTTKSILSKVNIDNISSYKALYLEHDAKNSLDWILLENIRKSVDII